MTARRHPEFRARLKERNFVAQIMARDEEVGRWFEFKDGAMETVGVNNASSCPKCSATRSSRRRTVGSSPYPSSPTSARGHAGRHATRGRGSGAERR